MASLSKPEIIIINSLLTGRDPRKGEYKLLKMLALIAIVPRLIIPYSSDNKQPVI
jgi:hypothetical protein